MDHSTTASLLYALLADTVARLPETVNFAQQLLITDIFQPQPWTLKSALTHSLPSLASASPPSPSASAASTAGAAQHSSSPAASLSTFAKLASLSSPTSPASATPPSPTAPTQSAAAVAAAAGSPKSLYCSACRKKFGSESTFKTHMSSKHSSTTPSPASPASTSSASAPNVSPAKAGSSLQSPTSSATAKSQALSDALSRQSTGKKQLSLGNLAAAVGDLHRAAQGFAKYGWVKDAASCLWLVLDHSLRHPEASSREQLVEGCFALARLLASLDYALASRLYLLGAEQLLGLASEDLENVSRSAASVPALFSAARELIHTRPALDKSLSTVMDLLLEVAHFQSLATANPLTAALLALAIESARLHFETHWKLVTETSLLLITLYTHASADEMALPPGMVGESLPVAWSRCEVDVWTLLIDLFFSALQTQTPGAPTHTHALIYAALACLNLALAVVSMNDLVALEREVLPRLGRWLDRTESAESRLSAVSNDQRQCLAVLAQCMRFTEQLSRAFLWSDLDAVCNFELVCRLKAASAQLARAANRYCAFPSFWSRKQASVHDIQQVMRSLLM